MYTPGIHYVARGTVKKVVAKLKVLRENCDIRKKERFFFASHEMALIEAYEEQ
jgi:hypothetical protein